MKTHIVLIYVDNFINGRDVSESIANHCFVDSARLLEVLRKELIFDSDTDVSKTSIAENVFIYDLDEFVTECNNQGIELENFWTTHIYLND